MTTGIKLAVGGLIVTVVTGYMAYQGASTSWQYYLTVDECFNDSANLSGSRLRVHGQIRSDSLSVAKDRGTAEFQLVGQHSNLKVVATGPLPDNLKEEIEVVVEGRLIDSETLGGDKVLTKCASKYQSRESVEDSGNTAISQREQTRESPR